jgi:ribosomal protein S18 acetylase RimI-like enzyme
MTAFRGIVREIHLGDREPLAEMLARVREFDAEEVEVALELIDHAIHRTDDYRVLVAVLDGASAIGGYVCYGPTPMTQGTFDLYWIATDPSLRRSGVGKALVMALEQTLATEGARLVRLETSSRDDYAATRAFYDRTEFEVLARIRDFYSVGDDLLIYGKYLR